MLVNLLLIEEISIQFMANKLKYWQNSDVRTEMSNTKSGLARYSYLYSIINIQSPMYFYLAHAEKF
jgi:hypothetical protein